MPNAQRPAFATRSLRVLLALALAMLGGLAINAPAGAQAPAPTTSTLTGFAAETVPSTGEPSLTGSTAQAQYPGTFANADQRCVPANLGPIERSTQAGAAADLCVRFQLTELAPPGDDPRQVIVDTPTGFAAFASNIPTCSAADFALADQTTAPRCAPNTQVGTAIARTNLLGLTIDAPAMVVALDPTDGEVARLGVSILAVGANIKLIIRAVLRPAPDVGLRTIIDGLPREANPGGGPQPLAVYGFALRLWGADTAIRPMPGRFAVNGTDCQTDQVTAISVTSYEGAQSSAVSSPYRLTGCDQVSFDPSATVVVDDPRPDVNTAATIRTRFAVPGDGLLPSTPANVNLALPTGLTLSAQIGAGDAGLPTCSAAQFAQTTLDPVTCPAASQVGTVRIRSPFLEREFTGQVFVGQQAAVGELPPLYIQAQLSEAADAPRVKLLGKTIVDENGRLQAQLTDLPQVLVSEFDVSLRGGPNSVFVTPEVCGSYTGGLLAEPTARRGTTAGGPFALDIATDCAVGGFTPVFSLGLTSQQAGASAPYGLAFGREDRSQRIGVSVINLPPGLVANLKGVPECPVAVAQASACPASTRVGTVSALAGVGPDPLQQGGAVYLTSREPGAVAGVAIDVPIRIGDIDLGHLVTFGRIDIRPEDQGLRITAAIPSTFKGLPTNLRSVSVALDRPGFARNPTRCGTLAQDSFFVGVGGATALARGAITVTGCEALPFSPSVELGVAGDTGPNGRPFVQVQVGSQDGAQSLAGTEVLLPDGLAVDLVQVARSCPIAQFRAGACPWVSQVGTISGSLTISDDPLEGKVFLLEPPPGSVLPAVGLQITGRFATQITGYTAVNQRTKQLITRFPVLPDIPLERLTISITGGEGGLLVANDELCDGAAPRILATFDAATGLRREGDTRTNCGQALGDTGPVGSAVLSGLANGRPSLRMNLSAPKGREIRRVDLSLPGGYDLVSKARARSSRYARLSKTGGSTRSRWVRSDQLRLYMPDGGAEQLRLVTRTGLIEVESRTLRRRKPAARFRARITFEDGGTVTLPILVSPRS